MRSFWGSPRKTTDTEKVASEELAEMVEAREKLEELLKKQKETLVNYNKLIKEKRELRDRLNKEVQLQIKAIQKIRGRNKNKVAALVKEAEALRRKRDKLRDKAMKCDDEEKKKALIDESNEIHYKAQEISDELRTLKFKKELESVSDKISTTASNASKAHASIFELEESKEATEKIKNLILGEFHKIKINIELANEEMDEEDFEGVVYIVEAWKRQRNEFVFNLSAGKLKTPGQLHSAIKSYRQIKYENGKWTVC